MKKSGYVRASNSVLRFIAEPRLTCLHASCGPPLPITKGIVFWNIKDRLDAQFFKFLGGTGVEVRQVSDVVGGPRNVAVVEEFAHNRLHAMLASGKIGRRVHRQHSKLRPQLEHQLRLQTLNLSSEIPNSEESPWVNVPARKHVLPIHSCQMAGSYIQSAVRDNAILDRHVLRDALPS